MANVTTTNPIKLDTEDLTGPIHTGRIRVTTVALRNDDAAEQTITLSDAAGDPVVLATVGANEEAVYHIDAWVNGIATVAIPNDNAVVQIWYK